MIGYKKNRAYYNTYLFTIGSIFTNLIVSAIFSRYLNVDEFLEFNVLSRYFGFFIAVGSGSVGFSLIYFLKKEREVQRLYGNAILVNFVITSIVAILAMLFGQELALYSDDAWPWFLFAFTWVLAQSFFHTVISLYRGLERFDEANQMTLTIKVILLLVVSVCCVFLNKSIFFFYGSIGIGSILILFYFVAKLEVRLLPRMQYAEAKEIINFSLSRWGDNIVRIGFPVFTILIVTVNAGIEIAGYVSILLLPLKAIESSLQPLVMTVFSKWVGKVSELSRSNILLIFVLSLCVCAIVILCVAILGEWLIAFWLTDTYRFLAEHLLILSFSFFPIISISLLRGMLEGEFEHSPSFIVNLLLLTLPTVFIWLPITLLSVVWMLLLVSYIRFFILGFIYWQKLKLVRIAD